MFAVQEKNNDESEGEKKKIDTLFKNVFPAWKIGAAMSRDVSMNQENINQFLSLLPSIF